RSACDRCAGNSRGGDLCHCPNHRSPAVRGGNWVRSAADDFRDFDGASAWHQGATGLFRVYCCRGSVLARRFGSRSQARTPKGEEIMNQRLSYGKVAHAVYKGMLALQDSVHKSGLEKDLMDLVCLRVSQINGCAFCIDMHWRDL